MNIVITNLLTSIKDPQRDKLFESDVTLLRDLLVSCRSLNQQIIILSDSLEDINYNKVKVVRCKSEINPYFQRWINIRDYLKENPCDNVFCVDATDVEVLHDPFPFIEKNKIYVGDEESKVNNKWLRKNHKGDFMNKLIGYYGNKTLLNAGVVGGSYEIMIQFLDKLIYLYHNTDNNLQLTDMALFNYVLYTYFKNNIVNGRMVTTVFKRYEDNSEAWFKHK